MTFVYAPNIFYDMYHFQPQIDAVLGMLVVWFRNTAHTVVAVSQKLDSQNVMFLKRV